MIINLPLIITYKSISVEDAEAFYVQLRSDCIMDQLNQARQDYRYDECMEVAEKAHYNLKLLASLTVVRMFNISTCTYNILLTFLCHVLFFENRYERRLPLMRQKEENDFFIDMKRSSIPLSLYKDMP